MLNFINSHYNKQTPVVIKDDGSLAFFSNESNKSSLKDRRSPREIYAALNEVIENAVFYDFRKSDGAEKHKNITGQYIYKSVFRIGQQIYAASIILNEKANTFTKVFKGYTIAEIKIEGIDATSGSKTTLREPDNRSMPSYITIAQAANNVNPNFSKNLDENGEPLVVYNGGKSGISIFDIEQTGKSNEFAKVGFWFSDEKSLADSFAKNWYNQTWNGKEYAPGNVYAVYLNIKNPKIYELELTHKMLQGVLRNYHDFSQVN